MKIWVKAILGVIGFAAIVLGLLLVVSLHPTHSLTTQLLLTLFFSTEEAVLLPRRALHRSLLHPQSGGMVRVGGARTRVGDGVGGERGGGRGGGSPEGARDAGQ